MSEEASRNLLKGLKISNLNISPKQGAEKQIQFHFISVGEEMDGKEVDRTAGSGGVWWDRERFLCPAFPCFSQF